MPTWLRKGPSPHQTALAMIGAKAGQRVLIYGAGRADLAAEIALITGLNGQTLVVDTDARALTNAEAAAGRAGALIDVAPATVRDLKTDVDAFDVAVVTATLESMSPADRLALVASIVRSLRPGGRVIVIDGEPARSVFGGFTSRRSRTLQPEEILAMLASAGTRAQRQLGSADGVSYYEGLKSRE